MIAAVAVAGTLAAELRHGPAGARAAQTKPNVIVIMTDDQRLDDLYARLGDRRLMPNTLKLLAGGGVTFARYYVAYPLSCPSRTTFLTGLYAHNHGVRANILPHKGYCGSPNVFPTTNSLAPWLNAAGYHTVIAGRYLNGYPGHRPATTVDPGWDDWFVPVEADGTLAALYFGYRLNENGTVSDPYRRPDGYITEVITKKLIDSIRSTPASQPVFGFLANRAPHEDQAPPVGPEPAPGDNKTISKIELPHRPDYDEKDVSDKPRYLRREPPLSHREKKKIKMRARRRRASLEAVDRQVKAIVNELKRDGRFNNTYIFFVSDNGFFLGEHRFPKGKVRPYEEASHVPGILIGPGIPHGRTSRELVSNIDLAPTILQVAGVSEDLDGRSLLPFADNPRKRTRRPLVIESFRDPNPKKTKFQKGNSRTEAPNYQALVAGHYKVVRYTTGDRELYDLKRDPNELNNVFASHRYARVRAFMIRWLKVFDGCSRESCRRQIPKPPPPLG